MWGKKKDGQSYQKTDKKGIKGSTSETSPVKDVHMREKMTLEDYRKLSKEDKEKIHQEDMQENKKIIAELTRDLDEDWLIAAMVEGSIGYYDPNAAMNALKNMKESGENYSERNMALYHGNAAEELRDDIRRFKWIVENDPVTAQNLIGYVKQTKNNNDFATNATFSMMYPTGGK